MRSAKVGLRWELWVRGGALGVGGEGRVKGGKALRGDDRQYCALAPRREYGGAMWLPSLKDDV